MEKKIEEKLIQELEEEKNGKEEKDTNKNELTGEDIKESYSLNTINKSKNIQDPTTEHFSKDENSIKLIKSQKIKKYKLYNFFIGEYEYKDRNKNLFIYILFPYFIYFKLIYNVIYNFIIYLKK